MNSDPFTLVTGDMRGSLFITHQDKQKEQAIVRIPLNQLLKVVDLMATITPFVSVRYAKMKYCSTLTCILVYHSQQRKCTIEMLQA